MYIHKIMGILAVMVLSAAGAMAMEGERRSPAHLYLSYMVSAPEMNLQDEDPVLYYVVNDKNCRAEIMLFDDRYYEINVWEDCQSQVRKKLHINPFSLCCLRKSDLLVVEEHLKDKSFTGPNFKPDYKGIIDMMVVARHNRFCNRRNKIVESVSNWIMDLVWYADFQLHSLPIGTILAESEDAKFYFEKLTILLNGAHSPFALLPTELRWKIAFNMLGILVPFEQSNSAGTLSKCLCCHSS